MAAITYIPSGSASPRGVVNAGGGVAFDVGAALAAGAGSFAVDSAQTTLTYVLDHFPGLMRSGGVAPPITPVDSIGILVGHTRRSGGASASSGDVATMGSDGLWVPAPSAGGGGSAPTLAQIAAAMPYVVELPESHGAVRDGITDDTAAINATIAAAVSRGLADGSNYAEIWGSAGVYKINGALIQGGSTFGNAQIPLPLINTSGQQKFTLVFVLPDTGAAVEHWTQTAAQKGGTVFDSNLQADFSATYGSPSVIGGPTPQQGVEFSAGATSRGSNMMFKVKGTLQINMSNPVVTASNSTPHGNALDLQQVAEVDIEGYRADAGIIWGNKKPPDGNGGAGVRMPQTGNNDNCRISTLSVQGYSNAIVVGEHTYIERAALVYCYRPVYWQSTAADSMSISSLSTEACVQHISTEGVGGPSGGFTCTTTILDWNVEDETDLATVAHVYDPNNCLRGEIVSFLRNKTAVGAAPDSVVAGATQQPPIFNGGAGFTLHDRRATPGSVTPPTVPASGSPFPLVYTGRVFYISGGTVSSIAVDGQVLGITSGSVRVPSGKALVITYTVAPTINAVIQD